MFDGAGTIADWAQVVIAVAGIAGVIYTLRQNTEALRATHKDFIASHPPDLQIGGIEIYRGDTSDLFRIDYKITNKGDGSAWVTEGGLFPTTDLETLYAEPDLPTFVTIPPIAPGETVRRSETFKWPDGFSPLDMPSEAVPFYLKGIFYYEDANGIKRYVQVFRHLDVERLRFAPFPEGHFFAHDRMAY